jgi:predicted alpha/beta superfamily hydrolase
MFKSNSQNGVLFKGFIAASPSIRWADGYLFEMEQQYSEKKDSLQCSLFLSSGSDELLVYNILAQEMRDRLMQRAYNDFKIEYINYKKEAHNETPIPSFVDGLKFVFNN